MDEAFYEKLANSRGTIEELAHSSDPNVAATHQKILDELTRIKGQK